MLGEKFALDIRPTFVDELDEVVAYIGLKLRNPAAPARPPQKLLPLGRKTMNLIGKQENE